MLVNCPKCSAHVDAQEHGQFAYGPGVERDPGRYVFLKCIRCHSPILVNQDHLAHSPFGDDWSEPAVMFPLADIRANPKAPPAIRAAIEEGIVCYKARAFTASAIRCRKTLEGVCEAHGITERTLHLSLKKMLDKDFIDRRLYDWSDELRITGNEAAHGVELVSSAQDARDALDFTIGIVDYLFSYRDQFEKFKARRAERSASGPV